MRSRKHTAWRKNRKFSDVHGGRTSAKIADRIFNRLHSLRPPAPGVERPVCIQDNPSRDYYFPLTAKQCLEALRALPESHYDGLTHLWLRRPSGVSRRSNLPLGQFICGSGVRLIVMYPWRVDHRLCFGRSRPHSETIRWYERLGGKFLRERGWWYAQFDAPSLRNLYVHVLFHEVGHHVDWYERRWSAANHKQTEDVAEQYAMSFARTGKAVVSGMLADDSQ